MDLSIGPTAGIAFFLMMFDVWIVNVVKRILCRVHGKRMGINFDLTPKIPSEFWIVLAVAIPVAVCVVVGLNLVESITGQALTDLPGWMGYVASGVLIGMGAQKTYDVSEGLRSYADKKGITTPKSWVPGGPNDASTTVAVPPQPPAEEQTAANPPVGTGEQ